MIFVNHIQSNRTTSLAENNITKRAIIDFDNSISYVKLKDIIKEYRPQYNAKRRNWKGVVLGTYSKKQH